MNTLLLIDGNGLLHRSFHALPPFKTKAGLLTNAVYGFATMLFRAVADFAPTHVAVCFDTKAPTFRKKIFKEYQKQRPKIKDELAQQFPLTKEFLDQTHIPYFEKAGWEADDLIGTIVAKTTAPNNKVLILTGDRDIVQLVGDTVSVISPQKGLSEIKLYNQNEVETKFGVSPDKIPDLKALMGDPSDNYKGAAGIGPKTAKELVSQFGSIEAIYQRIGDVKNQRVKDALVQNKENTLLSKKLATIVRKVPFRFDLKTCRFNGYPEDLKKFFIRLEFYSLIKRFFGQSAQKDITKKHNQEKKQLGLF